MNSEPHKQIGGIFKTQKIRYYQKKMHFYRHQKNVSTQIYCCVRQCVQPSTAVLYLKNMLRIHIKNVT